MKNFKIRYILSAIVFITSVIYTFYIMQFIDKSSSASIGPGSGREIFLPFIFTFIAYILGGIGDYLDQKAKCGFWLSLVFTGVLTFGLIKYFFLT